MKMNLSAQADKQVRRGVGVWIDSRKALIVAETDGAAGATVIRQITTNLEKQLRLSSG